MTHVGYKLVRYNLSSLLARGRFKLHYPLGEVVNTVNGTLGIMVFDTYDNAMGFACHLSFGYSILLVTYDSDDINTQIDSTRTQISVRTSELDLQNYYGYNIYVATRPMPYGTVLCSKIKVIAREEVIPQ